MGILRNIGRVVVDSARKSNPKAADREFQAAERARIKKITGRTYLNNNGVHVPDGYKWQKQPSGLWKIVEE